MEEVFLNLHFRNLFYQIDNEKREKEKCQMKLELKISSFKLIFIADLIDLIEQIVWIHYVHRKLKSFSQFESRKSLQNEFLLNELTKYSVMIEIQCDFQ